MAYSQEGYGETEIGLLVRRAGGVWYKKEKLWRLDIDTVKALGLENRIVKNHGRI